MLLPSSGLPDTRLHVAHFLTLLLVLLTFLLDSVIKFETTCDAEFRLECSVLLDVVSPAPPHEEGGTPYYSFTLTELGQTSGYERPPPHFSNQQEASSFNPLHFVTHRRDCVI